MTLFFEYEISISIIETVTEPEYTAEIDLDRFISDALPFEIKHNLIDEVKHIIVQRFQERFWQILPKQHFDIV